MDSVSISTCSTAEHGGNVARTEKISQTERRRRANVAKHFFPFQTEQYFCHASRDFMCNLFSLTIFHVVDTSPYTDAHHSGFFLKKTRNFHQHFIEAFQHVWFTLDAWRKRKCDRKFLLCIYIRIGASSINRP